MRETAVNRSRSLAGSGAVLVLLAISLAHAAGRDTALPPATGMALAVLIVAGFDTIPPRLRGTASILTIAGLAAAPFATAPFAALERGLHIAGTLVALTASVMLIAHGAMGDRRIRQLGMQLRILTGPRRIMAFTLASQFLSGILGLAGAHLMFVMGAPPEAVNTYDAERADTVVAVTRGYSAASCWSPVFGQMAALLVFYPGMRWEQIFPIGVVLGQLAIAVSLCLLWGARGSHAGHAHQTAIPAPATGTGIPPKSSLAGAALPLLAFLAAMLALSLCLHIALSAAITLLAPILAWLYLAAAGQPDRRVYAGWCGLKQGIGRFPALASEACLFAAACCAGSLLAAAFPPQWAADIGTLLSPMPAAGLAFLLLGVLLTALAGIHPVLSAVFLATTFSPLTLGLPSIAHLAALLAGWGVSASVTPFSVLSMTAARYAGESAFSISLVRNWTFAGIHLVLVHLLLTIFCLGVGDV